MGTQVKALISSYFIVLKYLFDFFSLKISLQVSIGNEKGIPR